MNTWSMMNLQDASSSSMEQIIFFNDYSMMIISLITLTILINMLSLLKNKLSNKFISQNQNIEIIWTIMPMLILIFMAMPSLKLLYLNDEINSPLMTIKSIGHQWYWSYEYSDFKNIEFDSFMINNSINKNWFRLLDVDNRMIIPFNNNIRMLISSTDVIHSWTMPSLNIKIDSIPGRINQTLLNMKRPGIYFGQCSEICGLNHSFMPIVIESTSPNKFIKWLNN